MPFPSTPAPSARIFTESGGWGLPTIDPDSLASIALLRFCNIPFSLSPGASPSMTSANLLPVILFEHQTSCPNTTNQLNDPSTESESLPPLAAGLPSLIALLTAHRTLPSPNAHLTPFMIAESSAFATLISARFGPAFLYEFYINDKNYADIYHTLLAKNSSFPLNRLLPFLKRRQIRTNLRGNKPEQLYFDSAFALEALSTRLGDRNKFFYQDQPSVLDAIVFGYLAPALYIPLPSTELRAQVASYPNLVAFVARVRNSFFATDGGRLIGQLDGDAIIEERRSQVETKSREGSSAADHGDSSNRQSRNSARQPTDESIAEQERKKWNQYFVWGSIAACAVHVLLGNEIEFEYE